MNTCPQCQTPISPGATVCPNCGLEFTALASTDRPVVKKSLSVGFWIAAALGILAIAALVGVFIYVVRTKSNEDKGFSQPPPAPANSSSQTGR